MSEIRKNMKKLTKIPPSEEIVGVFKSPEGEKNPPTLRGIKVKTSRLSAVGSLHIQIGHPKPETIWENVETDIGTPFAQGESGMFLRTYGAAFNISSADGSLDQHEMKELGNKLKSSPTQTRSYASDSMDYVDVDFVKVAEIEDNEGNPVNALEFLVGGSETLYIAYSHLEPLDKNEEEKYPVVRPEWLLAWMIANYFEGEE